MKRRFGASVRKVPVNGGFSCPNRDGTKSTVGCLFCDNRSFSPAEPYAAVSPKEQLLRYAVHNNGKKHLFLPYLQPFSNTYGTVEMLKAVYEPLLAVPGVIGLAIGTRPDCFTDDIYRYLESLSRRTYISVELGLQSAHDSTLSLCNRGHSAAQFSQAVTRLSSMGIETVAHVMIGLPGESKDMIRQTAQFCASSSCNGVKIHQLMIIRDTAFEQWYKRSDITVLTIIEYAELLADFLKHLRSDQQIHRIMAEATVANGLIAPEWSADKMNSLHVLQNYLKTHAVVQGSCFSDV